LLASLACAHRQQHTSPQRAACSSTALPASAGDRWRRHAAAACAPAAHQAMPFTCRCTPTCCSLPQPLLPCCRRFDDRVTGKLEAFATHARIVHIDVDPAEIHKNKHAHIPLCADVKPALKLLNKLLEQEPINPTQYEAWRQELDSKKQEFPMRYPERDDVIIPQHAVKVGGMAQQAACGPLSLVWHSAAACIWAYRR
jgi:hypothetical protein